MQRYKLLERALAAAGFTSSLFLFLPLTVYFLNLASTSTPKSSIVLCGGTFALVFAALLTVASFLPMVGSWIHTGCKIGVVIVVLLTIFPNHTGEISGFAASFDPVKDVAALAKLLVLLTTCSWLSWRKPHVLSQITNYSLIVVLLVTVYVALGPLSTADKKIKKRQAVPPSNFTQLGVKNVIVVIYDCFTGYRMAEILKEKPELRAELTGFRYYPAALASGKNTPAGLGAILTGDLKMSVASGSIEERVGASLNNSFIMDAKRLGYTTGFISNIGGKGVEVPVSASGSFFEQRPLSLFTRLPSYAGFFALSLSRVAPSQLCSVLKAGAERTTVHVRKNARTDWDLLNSLQDYLERFNVSSKMALKYFIDNLHVTKGKGSVLVLHSVVTHPPHNFDESGNFVRDDGHGFEGASTYAARELARLCKKLRSLGVYDSTLIIAVADHGALDIKDKTMGGRFSTRTFPVDYNSLLMVKPPTASGPCRDSNMSAWIGDVATTVRDYLNVPVDSQAMFSTRSLLQTDMPHRALNVPVFFKPEKSTYHSSLSEWVRQDFNGTFEAYGDIFSSTPGSLLKQHATITAFSGQDQSEQKAKSKKIGYIEVNGRQLSKLDRPGILVVTEESNKYHVQAFNDFRAAEAFLLKIPAGRDRLIVGVQVPSEIIKNIFPNYKEGKTKVVGFVSVDGPSCGKGAQTLVGEGDLNVELIWK